MIWFQLEMTSEEEMVPPLMLKSPVSKVAVGLMRVHMTGVRPMAVAMARTRSLKNKEIRVSDLVTPIRERYDDQTK